MQSGMDFVSKITASTSAVFNVLLKRVEILGGAIVAFFKGNFSEAAEIAKQVAQEAAKVAKALDEGGCECGGYSCYCGNYGDASSASSAATASLIARQIIGMMRGK
jgi:hypothetical protein